MAAYSTTVLADSPLLFWRFLEDDSSFNFTDSSGNGQTGLQAGDLGMVRRRGPALTIERPSASAIFHGISGVSGDVQRTVTGLSTTAGTKTTVECWATIGLDGANCVLFGFTEGPAGALSLWYDGANLGFNTGAGDLYGIASAQLTHLDLERGEPFHVVAVFNSDDYTQNKIYINAVLQTLAQQFGSPGNDFVGTKFVLGSNSNNTYTWNGKIAECAVYNGELSQARITAHHDAGRPSPTPYDTAVLALSPLGYWKGDEQSGQYLDATGNGNHATVSPIIYRELPGPFGGRAMKFGSVEPDSGGWTDATISGLNTAGGTDVTVMFWLHIYPGVTGGVPMTWANGTTNFGLFLRTAPWRFGFNTWNNDAFGLAVPDDFNPFGLWRMVVAKFRNGDRANCELWMDGKKRGGLNDVQSEGGTNTTAGATFRLGVGEGGNPTYCKIARPAVFNGTLSDSQIANLYSIAFAANQTGSKVPGVMVR